jgi:hypothetical protein
VEIQAFCGGLTGDLVQIGIIIAATPRVAKGKPRFFLCTLVSKCDFEKSGHFTSHCIGNRTVNAVPGFFAGLYDWFHTFAVEFALQIQVLYCQSQTSRWLQLDIEVKPGATAGFHLGPKAIRRSPQRKHIRGYQLHSADIA